jgi:hypothetical protein
MEEESSLKQILMGILIGGAAIFVLANFKIPSLTEKPQKSSANENLVSQIVNQVLPSQGFQTRLVFGDTVKKMIDCGVLELAASQGYNEDELYKLALQLNSFWFPQSYIETAIYFKVFENKDWQNIDPKLVMSRGYSSISGWMQNVHKKVAELKLPQIQSGGGCGL